MSNVHYDLFCLAELPPELTVLDRQLLGHMCARYNEKETPPKAWPGADELARITGSKPESNSRSIGRLVNYTFLLRVTRAFKGKGGQRGNRGEYAPNLRLIASYITDELSIKNEKVLALYRNLTKETALDNLPDAITNPTDVITYPTSYAKPIEPNNLIKRIDTKRWLLITSKIPTEYMTYINPGHNYEMLLNQCNANGHTNEHLADVIGRTDFYNAYKKGGLLNDVLQGLAGGKSVRKSKSGLPHCGDTFCDPVTRTFPEPSEINGRLDNRCRNCNEQLINETKRRNHPPPFDVGNLWKLPDE